MYEKAVAEARFLASPPGTGGTAATDSAGASAAAPDEIGTSLAARCAELRESRYWESLRGVLGARFGNGNNRGNHRGIRSVVCYGIGNFGTARPSAPQWQLALALLLREHAGHNNDNDNDNTNNDDNTNNNDNGGVAVHYFEPLMTDAEAEVLRNRNVEIIAENERGKRTIGGGDDGDAGGGGGTTLFFMPHCPMGLYANVLHANWEILRRTATSSSSSSSSVAIFGNTLENYLTGIGGVGINDDGDEGRRQRRQALGVLESVRPFWVVDPLTIDRRDVGDLPAYFENAFNDSSLTTFVAVADDDDDAGGGWPDRPPLDDFDGSGGAGGEIL